MAMSRNNQCAKVGETITKLKKLLCDDPKQILMLAAGQNGLDITFTNVLQDPSLRTFICSVEVGNLLDGCMGYGQTKEEAKMNAAEEAIRELVNGVKNLSPSTSSAKVESTRNDSLSKRTNPFLSSRLLSKPETVESDAACDIYGTGYVSFSSRRGDTLSTHNLESKEALFSPQHQSSSRQLFERPISARGPPALYVGSPMDTSSGSFDNPIGTLQELAQKNQWSVPEYDEIYEYGEDHKKTFVYTCKFRNKTSEGTASTKRAAKRKAAEEMLELIGNKRSPGKKTHSEITPQTHRMRSSQALQPGPGDYCDRLRRLASRNSWTLEWHEDLERGLSGNYLCFARLDTDPVTVCAGRGPSKICAREDAAMNALKILK